MAEIEIVGGGPLRGELSVQGSKNAVLPMMAAAVLNQGVTVIEHVPGIRDVRCMMEILSSLGCSCTLDKSGRLTIDAERLSGSCVRKEDMEKIGDSSGAAAGQAGKGLHLLSRRLHDWKTAH